MAAKYNFNLDQGATLSKTFTLDIASAGIETLDDVVFRSELRRSYESEECLAVFTFSVIDATDGIFVMELPADETALIPAGVWVYDVEMVNPTTERIVRLVEGRVTVTPEVTRCQTSA